MHRGIVHGMTDLDASPSGWPEEPTELLGMPAFGFADAGPVRDALTAAVLSGEKTATTSLVVDYVIDGAPLPTLGGRSVIFGSDLRPVAIVETTAWRLWTVGLVDDAFAAAEGEGYADAAAWRIAHEGSWAMSLDLYRRALHDPDFAITTSTAVVCEWFRLIERLDAGGQSPS
jgi:uncharacterized protein YhfF